MPELGNNDWWPDSPIQSLRRQKHTMTSEGEFAPYDPTLFVDTRGNRAEPGMGFTLADYDAASLDNVAFNMARDMFRGCK